MGIIKKLLKNEFSFLKTTRKTLNNAFSRLNGNRRWEYRGREEEEVYHLDSNLSAEFLAMKVLKKGQSKTYVSL